MTLTYKQGKNLIETLAAIIDRHMGDPNTSERIATEIVEELDGQLSYDGGGNSSYGSWNSSSAYC